MTERSSALLTDLYQINMMQAYLDRGVTDTAVFELFVRNLPLRRGFLVAAGLEQALQFLETLQFSESEIEWLRSTGRFRPNLIDYMKNKQIVFNTDVDIAAFRKRMDPVYAGLHTQLGGDIVERVMKVASSG